MRFIDTNVLLYLVSTAPGEAAKRRAAADLMEIEDLALSVQVLLEFYEQATRARGAGLGALTHEQAVLLIEAFMRFPVQEMTVAVSLAAMETKRRYGISLRDAAIVEAPRSMGCSTVLSQDLSDGQTYATVRVVNPFRRGRREGGGGQECPGDASPGRGSGQRVVYSFRVKLTSTSVITSTGRPLRRVGW